MIEFVPSGTHIDFIGRWKYTAMLSVAVIAAGLAALPFRLQMGIDFAGGWEIQARFEDSVRSDESAIRSALDEIAEGVSVVRFGSDHEYLIRFSVQEGEDPNVPLPDVDATPSAETPPEAPTPQGVAPPGEAAEAPAPEAEIEPVDPEVESPMPGAPNLAEEPELGAAPGFAQGQRADQIRTRLAERIGPVSLDRIEFVGPRVGAELRRAGLLSLLLAGAMILVYISFRFTFRFAPGAIVALLHDVLVTSGIWVLMGREFNLQVLAALLAIVGYSLNDTIIVYDRIRENMELRTTTDLPEVLNRSINQTLSRTVLTSVTTLLAVLSLLFLGGEVIHPFASAMAIGIVIGTYSSVFVAAPVLLWLESRQGSAPTAAAAS